MNAQALPLAGRLWEPGGSFHHSKCAYFHAFPDMCNDSDPIHMGHLRMWPSLGSLWKTGGEGEVSPLPVIHLSFVAGSEIAALPS